jgi:WXG100 family type VII secretion target
MSTSRVHFDMHGVQSLADAQSSYHARFEQVLGEVKTAVNSMLGQWLGDGTDEYRAKQQSFDSSYEQLQAAFDNLQRQTVNAHGNFTSGTQQIRNIWA